MKKKRIWLIVAAVILAAGIACGFLTGKTEKKIRPQETVPCSEVTDQKIQLTAHRGLSSQAPENTLPALELAAKNGFTSVEFDVQLTLDGIWVLSHDDTIDRMTDGSGKIAEKTYFDLAGYSINNGANYQSYENLKMPLLDDALDVCLKNDLRPMIEIKNYTENGLKKLVASIEKHGYENSCYVISFDHAALEKVQELNSDIPLAYLVSKLDDAHMKTCLSSAEIGVSFHADQKYNNAEKIKKLKKAGIELFCWVADDGEPIAFYAPLGVKNFVTNRIVP